MNTKQTLKQWMIITAIMTICGSLLLASCSDDDNAVVVTDNKPWTISPGDMDPTVRPGDKLYLKPEERTHI